MNITELYNAISGMNNRIKNYKKAKRVGDLDTCEQKELEFIGELITGAEDSAEDVLKKFQNSAVYESVDEYYHYTDLNGLLGIFKKYVESGGDLVSECTMRASHIRFLNDSQEYIEGSKKYNKYLETYGKQIGKLSGEAQKSEYINNALTFYNKLFEGDDQFCESIKNLIDTDNKGSDDELLTFDSKDCEEDIYSISFCGDGNLLSQWKYYGKNSGIAIKFNLENAKAIIGNQDKNQIDAKPLKVAYIEEDKKILFAMSCLVINLDEFITQKPQADIFMPYCKNESFKEENESRLVFTRPDKVKSEYAISEGRIKPFIPITFKASEGKNIIDSITVGPGQNQNLVYNALIHIFDSDSFKFDDKNGKHECKNGVRIIKSEIPFRG